MSRYSKVLGKEWVTAAGCGREAFTAALTGKDGHLENIAAPSWGGHYDILTVPPPARDTSNRHPRMRRAGRISHFAIQAAKGAILDAGFAERTDALREMAVVFAVSSGGVDYTRRFFQTVTETGASQASPLLFPETVYNAPASHLAAQIGANGITYTLVGDGSVGMSALGLADTLLKTGEARHVLVIGAEEVDPVLCEAYAVWRFAPRLRDPQSRSIPLGEGAAALLLGADSGDDTSAGAELRYVDPGITFFRQKELPEASEELFQRLALHAENPVAVVRSAWRPPFSAVEKDAVHTTFASARIHEPKRTFGETLGASALMQSVFALHLLENADGPVVVSSFGFNQQISGLVLANQITPDADHR